MPRGLRAVDALDGDDGRGFPLPEKNTPTDMIAFRPGPLGRPKNE